VFAADRTPSRENPVELSARNQLAGKVTSVKAEGLMAEVAVDVGGGTELVSTITKTSALRLGLKAGDQVTVVFKASEVLIAK
jgi:molybdate transport system regulatory protein